MNKIVVLNGEGSGLKAVLNLSQNNSGSIKFFNYNFANKHLALAIKQNETIEKIPLKNIANGSAMFNASSKINSKNNFLCAVVDVTNAFCPQIVFSGSLNSKQENKSMEDCFVASKPQDVSNLYVEDSDDEINNLVENNMQDDNTCNYFDGCKHCKYKEAFYNSAENFATQKSIGALTSKKEETKEDEKTKNDTISEGLEQNEEGNKFYLQIKNQIDDMFNKYGRDEILEGILPNSMWVKISAEEQKATYVLGLINDDENKKVEYIGFGIYYTTFANPPDDIKDVVKWLPINKDNEQGEGYYISYQSAETGDNVDIKFV